MDLLKFEPTGMYYDETASADVEALIAAAGEARDPATAEAKLKQAEHLAPENLSVLVALYRFYFYGHRMSAALGIAETALDVVAKRLDFDPLWHHVADEDIARAMAEKPELARFYLHTLKGAGYLLLRLGLHDKGLARLDHVAGVDPQDRLGAAALADVARQALSETAA